MIRPMVLIHKILDPLLSSLTDFLGITLRGGLVSASSFMSYVDMLSYNAYSFKQIRSTEVPPMQ